MIALPRPIIAIALLLVVSVAVSACSSDSGVDDERIAGIIHRLLLAAGTEGSEKLESFPGALPDDLPVDLPIYPGADLLVSNRQPAPFTDFDSSSSDLPQPLLYFIVIDTSDSREDVYAFYEEALDEDPWQVQSSFSTEQLDTLQFFYVKDIDIGGVVSIASGGADGRTSVLISLQDAGAFVEEEPPFQLQPSLALPRAFPPDMPMFDDATITGTAFFREPGLQSFLVVFLTTAGQDDVIEFYREALQGNGWTVQDTAAFGLEGRIDFSDAAGDIQGDIFANRFPRARQYTEVSVQVQLDPSREVSTPVDEDDQSTLEPAEEVARVAAPAR